MVELILIDIRIELSQLIVAICGISIILDLEVAIAKQRQTCSISWQELEFTREDIYDLVVLLVSQQRVDGLRILPIWHRFKSVVHSCINLYALY